MLTKYLRRQKIPSDRCETCRKFLTSAEKDMGYCKSCAAKEIKLIQKSIGLRFLCCMLLIALVFFVSYYVRNSAVEGELVFSDVYARVIVEERASVNMLIPLPFSGAVLAINRHAFRAMFEPAPQTELLRAVLIASGSFGGRFKLKSDKYRSRIAEAQVQAATVERSFTMGSPHSQESTGLLLIEIFLTVISGPFFFVYRPYRIIKLRAYIKETEGQI